MIKNIIMREKGFPGAKFRRYDLLRFAFIDYLSIPLC